MKSSRSARVQQAISVVMVMAVVGVIVWSQFANNKRTRRLTEQEPPSAEAKLRELGAVLSMASDGSGKIVSVEFVRDRAVDDDLLLLKQLPHLERIDLSAQRKISDRGIAHLVEHQQLRELNLSGTKVTDEGIRAIGQLTGLRRLYLFRTTIGEEGLRELASLPNLEFLNLWDTPLTPPCFRLLPQFPALRTLHLGNTSWESESMPRESGRYASGEFSDEVVARLRREMPQTVIVYWDESSPESPPATPIESAAPTLRATFATELDVETTRRDRRHVAQAETGLTFDWPSLLGPQGDLSVADTEIVWARTEPKMKWRMQLGEGYSSPVLNGNRLYVTDRLANRDRLVCLTADQGSELWCSSVATDFVDFGGYGDGPRATPVIDEGSVYTYSPTGLLVSWRADDGSLQWSIDMASRYAPPQLMYGVGASPIVYGDQLLVVVGGGGSRNQDCLLVAVDKRTGEVLWHGGTDAGSYAVPVVTTHEGDTIVYVFGRSGLSAIGAGSGELLAFFPWAARKAGCVNAATPLVIGEQVLISEAYGDGGAMVEFQGEQFGLVWQDELRSREKRVACHFGTPVVVGPHIFAASGRRTVNTELHCVDWRTGELLWSEPWYERFGLLTLGKSLICVGESGSLVVVNATGDGFDLIRRWHLNDDWPALDDEPNVTYPIWAAPVMSNRHLFIRGRQHLVCLEF